jgi:hypothetical protein
LFKMSDAVIRIKLIQLKETQDKTAIRDKQPRELCW